MTKENFLLNLPVKVKKNLYIYPPLVKELIENENAWAYVKLLTQSQEDIEDEIMKKNKNSKDFPTPFEDLFLKAKEAPMFEHFLKEAFKFFIHDEVNFLYDLRLIVVGNLEEVVQKLGNIDDLIYICENDFFNFQNVIRESVGEKIIEAPDPNEHPRIKEMKRKARYRDRVKAKQASKTGEGISFFTMLVSICCMGLGITPLNIGEMSYSAVKSILQKYQDKEKYQLDIDSLLAGGDSKKIHPKYWIKNLDD